MTQVYITRTGAKYHADQDCPAFLDAERRNGRVVTRWPVSLRKLDKEPCSVCWPGTANYDSWKQLEHRVEREGDSVFEAVFVDQVLRHVPNLRPDDVMVQRPAEGRSGKMYRLDFVLEAATGERIAVEVDGLDKAPGRASIDDIQRQVDAKRADLIRAGWRVLNFSNDRVATRSHECIAELEAAMASAIRPRPAMDSVPPRRPEGPRASAVAPPATSGGSATPGQPQGRSSRPALLITAAAALPLVVGGIWLAGQGDEEAQTYAPQGQSCPGDAPVKGNINDSGEKIFHEPGWRYYTATWPEACFSSASVAEDEGYRASEVR